MMSYSRGRGVRPKISITPSGPETSAGQINRLDISLPRPIGECLLANVGFARNGGHALWPVSCSYVVRFSLDARLLLPPVASARCGERKNPGGVRFRAARPGQSLCSRLAGASSLPQPVGGARSGPTLDRPCGRQGPSQAALPIRFRTPCDAESVRQLAKRRHDPVWMQPVAIERRPVRSMRGSPG